MRWMSLKYFYVGLFVVWAWMFIVDRLGGLI